MSGYFALLRGINVGGRGALKMDALRKAFESMGFSSVTTFIASGNVYFEARAAGGAVLERMLDKGLTLRLGRPTTTFVRTVAEMRRIAAHDPFKSDAMTNADINIVFLGRKPAEAALRMLNALSPRTDEFRAHGREIYWLRRKLPGRPDYASVPLDKALQAPFTTRGLRTLQKMTARYAAAM